MSAAAVFSIATAAAHADELSDVKAQSEQIREQNQVLAKQVVELEKRLHKLETQPAKQPVVAARPAPPTNPPTPAAGNYNKAPSIVADDGSLTWHGITLYGGIDMGLAYQTHGTPLSNSAVYLRQSRGFSIWTATTSPGRAPSTKSGPVTPLR